MVGIGGGVGVRVAEGGGGNGARGWEGRLFITERVIFAFADFALGVIDQKMQPIHTHTHTHTHARTHAQSQIDFDIFLYL